MILSSKEWIAENLHQYFRHTGAALSPFNAWVMIKGLETMPLRVERMSATAAQLAVMIADHPAVARCLYPGRDDHPQRDLVKKQMTGGSTMLAFELKGGKKAAFQFCNAATIPLISNNLGDVRSIITHPATTTHQTVAPEMRAELGITDGLIRFSTGLEDVQDLMDDLSQALDAAR